MMGRKSDHRWWERNMVCSVSALNDLLTKMMDDGIAGVRLRNFRSYC